MTAFTDRTLGPIRRLIRSATRRVDYYALYSAVVNTDNGDETCDLTPEDRRLPSMSKIPKLYGVPGTTSTLAAGSKVLLCFQNGDPSRPCIVQYGTGAPTKVVLAPSAELDLVGSTDAVALASLANARLSSIWVLLNAVVAADNNAGLIGARTTLLAAQPGFPASVASTKVKAT